MDDAIAADARNFFDAVFAAVAAGDDAAAVARRVSALARTASHLLALRWI